MPSLQHDGADADAGVEVAGVGQVADRAAVGAALDRLELVDDLHRADLRRAGQRAGGQDRAQRVHRPDVRPQPPADRGDDVHHVRVGLDGHERLDLDRAVLAHAAEVVAAEVDEHHVLGALLLVGQQVLRRSRRPASASPPRGRVPAIGRVVARPPRDGEQRLGRRADDLEVLEVQEVHVRRRVDRPQPAVDRERLDRRPRPTSAATGRPGRRRRRGRTRRSARPSPRTPRAACSARTRARRRRAPSQPRQRAGEPLAHLGDRARARARSRPRRRPPRRRRWRGSSPCA